MRQAWIVVDMVDGQVTRAHAEKVYKRDGDRTLIHNHPHSEARCNEGCKVWPVDE